MAFGDGVGNDGGGGAVFDAAAGVEPLGLAVELDAGEVRGEAVEAHEGRVADALEEGGTESGGGCGDHDFREV